MGWPQFQQQWVAGHLGNQQGISLPAGLHLQAPWHYHLSHSVSWSFARSRTRVHTDETKWCIFCWLADNQPSGPRPCLHITSKLQTEAARLSVLSPCLSLFDSFKWHIVSFVSNRRETKPIKWNRCRFRVHLDGGAVEQDSGGWSPDRTAVPHDGVER